MTEIMYHGIKALLAENGNIYAICSECGDLVQLNKFIFGDLHNCN